eukprot:517608-Amphidinium_carterae.1
MLLRAFTASVSPLGWLPNGLCEQQLPNRVKERIWGKVSCRAGSYNPVNTGQATALHSRALLAPAQRGR